MLAVPLSEAELRPPCSVPTLDPRRGQRARGCAWLSGPDEAMAALEERPRGARASRPAASTTSHAFHSAMMEPILDAFRERVAAAHPPAAVACRSSRT